MRRRTLLSSRHAPLGAAALVLLALPAAHASSVGSTFSGPVAVSGGTSYWNPAAAASMPNERAAMLEVGLSPIQVGYDRANDPNDGRTFQEQRFLTLLPEPLFTVTAPTPLEWLMVQAGGFPLMGAGARWSEDGPQRYFSSSSSQFAYAVQLGGLIKPTDDFAIGVLGFVTYSWLVMRNSIDFGAFANNVLGASLFPYEDPMLEGRTQINASGWSTGLTLSLWGRPQPWLQLGWSLIMPRDATMHGTMQLDASDALQRTLPGFALRPDGKVTIKYPMAWETHLGASADFDVYRLSAQFTYARRSLQQVILASVTEADQDFIEGRQTSAKGVHDDWEIALRLERPIDDDWKMSALLDYDPRYVPNESMTPINLDFTRYEVGVGARYRMNERTTFVLGMSYIYLTTVHVKNSLFNPQASGDSGLSLPSANGDYWARAIKFVFGVEGHWDTPPVAATAP